MQLIGHNSGKQRQNYILIICIVLITAIKINLMGVGFMSANSDENRCTSSGVALRDLSEKNFRTAIHTLFYTSARPGEAIIKIIPNAVQVLTARTFNLWYFESKNSYPLFIFNFIIYCLILIVHFKISKLY